MANISEAGSNKTLIIRAPRLFDGAGNEHRDGASVWVEGERIKAVYGPEAPPSPPEAQVLDFPDGCILPGLMDSHVHLMFGEAGRTYKDVWHNDTDSLMAMRGPRNAYLHLRAGVTTVRDAGAVRDVGFAIKRGAEAGLFLAPRILVTGRPVTVTGGHFWWCGQEADGLEFIGRFHEMGVPIVAGTDSISRFGDYALGLQLFHRAGLTPMELVVSATSLAAKSIGMDDQVGTVKPGLLADLVYLDGDPLSDVAAFGQVGAVVLNGQLVVDKRFDDRSIDDTLPIPDGTIFYFDQP